MRYTSPIAVCLGAIVGFVGCCVLGHLVARKNVYTHFLRLHPFLEQETVYSPTASELIAVVHAQCPPVADKTPVIIGGNSVFNGSGQKHDELWSQVLQTELGVHYQVINFSAPGAGVVDNGGVVFEAISREYPQALFVTNTEPGRYPSANQSAYSYLFWDAYDKGLLLPDARREARLTRADRTVDQRELELGRRLNSVCYFNDLWTYAAYRYFSTVWTPWLKERSLRPRRRLPDWYDKRPRAETGESAFEKMLPGHLEALRHRPPAAAERFQLGSDGAWMQTPESLQQDEAQIAALLPEPLPRRSLIVFTPYNPWFVSRLSDAERSRLALSFQNGVTQLGAAGFHALSLADRGFEPADFGDTVHLTPAGGRKLAHLVAEAVRALDAEAQHKPER